MLLNPFGSIASGGLNLQEHDASKLIAGKSNEMIVLKPFPAVLETPMEMLVKEKITPVSHLFVRNNQQPKQAATVEPLSGKGWKIKLSGLVSKQVEFEASELLEMPQTEYEMVLQCSGNSRSLYALAVQSKGTQWGRGGVGNVRFAGVKLSKILEAKGVDVKNGAKWIRAMGHDKPLADKEDFEHSLPIEDVLNTAIIATSLNGKSLPAIHGGPARLVTPGIFGTMQVKWLSELAFENEESMNYNHIPRYRVPKSKIKPGTDFKFTFENSTFNWKMKTKSIICTPLPKTQIRESKGIVVSGIAFNDGECPIETVLISTDMGNSWSKARLAKSDSKYGWTTFEARVTLTKGKHQIWSRAVDQFGRSQPLDGTIDWNPRGYEWNGVEKIDVEVA